MNTRFVTLLLITWSILTPIFAHGQKKKAAVKAPTAAEAAAFVNDAEKKLSDLADQQQRASWVNENFITDDTDKISTEFNNEVSATTTPLAIEAKRYEKAKGLSPEVARKLYLLKLQLTLPTPKDSKLM